MRARRVPWPVSYVALAAIWGCSFWWIKLGLESFEPVQVAFARLLLGALTLAVLCLATGTRLPRSRTTWRHLAVIALLFNSVPFTLIAFSETRISSVLAGLINAATPLATLLVVLVAFPEEPRTLARAVGLAVGFVGVLVVIGVWEGLAGGELAGILGMLGAVCCYGISFPYARRHLSSTGETPVALATAQIALGAVFLAPVVGLGVLTGHGAVDTPISAATVAGLLGLGALGTGVAYVLNYDVLGEAGPTVASTVTYLVPIFAVVVGTVFLDEALAWYQPVGGLVVLLGVAISQGYVRLPSRTPHPEVRQ